MKNTTYFFCALSVCGMLTAYASASGVITVPAGSFKYKCIAELGEQRDQDYVQLRAPFQVTREDFARSSSGDGSVSVKIKKSDWKLAFRSPENGQTWWPDPKEGHLITLAVFNDVKGNAKTHAYIRVIKNTEKARLNGEADTYIDGIAPGMHPRASVISVPLDVSGKPDWENSFIMSLGVDCKLSK